MRLAPNLAQSRAGGETASQTPPASNSASCATPARSAHGEHARAGPRSLAEHPGPKQRLDDVPAILAQSDELCERIFDLEDRIENLDVSGVDVPQKAAAIYMITQTRQLLDHQPISDVTVLMVLKLMLRGLIREHADVAAKDCESPICTMPFYAA